MKLEKLLLIFFLVGSVLCIGTDFIKQDTATTVKSGPFVSSTDGYTIQSSLDINQTEVWLSKNGGILTQQSAIDVASACIGYWPMNDNDGETQVDDISGNNNYGTAQQITSNLHTDSGDPPYLSGALTFNGTTDDVNVGSVVGTGAYTKAAWIKIIAGSVNNNIISTGNIDYSHIFWAPEMYDYKLTAGNMSVDDVQDTVPLVIDTWYFVAVTFDPDVESGKMILYKDGNSVDSATGVPNPSVSPTDYIGRFFDGSYFKGIIDGVMIFDKALSEDEISYLYNDGNGLEIILKIASYDKLGYYDIELSADDTNTTGQLLLAVQKDGSLPMWQNFEVLPANVYDSLLGTDSLQVDAVQIKGVDATDKLIADINETFGPPPYTADMDQNDVGKAVDLYSVKVTTIADDVNTVKADTNDLKATRGVPRID